MELPVCRSNGIIPFERSLVIIVFPNLSLVF